MNIQAANLNHLWGVLLVEELYRQGCSLFCVSPGSRSTPLTVAAARHPSVETQICVDERAAAFFALGYGRATGKPAVLLCTSGTAVANYLPAVIEASVDHVPLIICSADRPPELLQTGANQTIQQHGLLGEYVRWKTQLPCPSLDIPAISVLTTVDQAYHQSTRAPAGPVHINCMFREPLAPHDAPIPASYLEPLHVWEQQQTPYTTYAANELALSEQQLQALARELGQASRGLLVLGRLPASADVSAIQACCDALGWPVLADIGSGLRLGPKTWSFVQAHDVLLRQPGWTEQFRPDLILHLGGPLVSKWFLRFLQTHESARYIQIHNHPERMDPNHRVSWRLEADPVRCCECLLPHLVSAPPSVWSQTWRSVGLEIQDAIDTWMDANHVEPPALLHEPAVAYHLSRRIPRNHALFVGNSMPIRDWDMFASTRGQPAPVGANRGASGIDGLLATALGMVRGTGTPGTLVLGDLSLLHDLHSLLLLQQSQLPLTVVVNNNQGGGIFGFLPIAQFDDVFTSHFLTPHCFALAAIARSIGIQAHTVDSLPAMLEAYDRAVASDKPGLIEVQSQRQHNVQFHRDFERCVAEIVARYLTDAQATPRSLR